MQRKSKKINLIENLESRRLLSTIYVDAIAPGPTHNGSSWTDAYTDLQSALTAATSGTTIEVSQGTYKPASGTDRTISFNLKTGVAIYGGYAGYGATNPDSRNVSQYLTILSGDIGTIGTTTDNSYHVVVGSGTTSTAVLDGFTITAGNANGSGATAVGGGMITSSGSPTVNNCTFTANLGTNNAAMENNSSPATITNCTFTTNGPLAPPSTLISGIENDASAATISNCTFTGNYSTALENNGSNATITNCTFTLNDGSPLINMSSSPTITACTFDGNISGGSGGAIYNSGGSPKIINCIFVANETQAGSTYYGGAIYNGSSATVSIDDCTFTDNVASGYGGAVFASSSTVNVYNCILWNDSAPFGAETYSSGSTLSLSGSDNGNVNPEFIQPPTAGPDGIWFDLDDNYGNVDIEPWSPVVDAGNNSVIPSGLTTDFAGNPRRTDIPTVNNTGSGTSPIVDQGAYEAVPGLLSSPGGPYVVLQGQSSITLAGNGVGTVSGTLTYAWDFTGSGTFSRPTSQNPVLPTSALSLGVHTISLKVTDAGGYSIVASTTVTIVPPIIYVDRRASSDAQTGYDWADALPDLASALSNAISGQTIEVATGTYYPTTGTTRSVAFYMRSGVNVLGGYAGYGASDPDLRNFVNDATVLSGDIGTPGVATDNSDSVVLSNVPSATLDGFTITGGYDALDGGGIELVAGSLAISNCTLTANYGIYGGGLYVGKSAAATVSNCSFSNDTASYGDGVYTDTSSTGTFTNCQFSGSIGGGSSVADYNNTSSTTTFTGCTFTGNSAGSIYNNGTNTVTNCSFTLNVGINGVGGGGVDNNASAVSTITNCSFLGNTNAVTNNYATSCAITNSIFVGNTGQNGAINNTGTSSRIINCTFVSNTATITSASVGGALSLYNTSSPVIANCIFWNNYSLYGTQIYVASQVAPTIIYNDIQGGYSGTGNLNVNPLFVDTPNPGPDGKWNTSDDHYGNVAISAASPVADQGDKNYLPSGITTDLAGNPRQQDIPTTPNGAYGYVDMGAYEAVPALAVATGGPYEVLQNQSLTLNGYGASNLSGALQFAWDWTGSGLFTDATGANPVFPVSSFPVGSTVDLAMRVTDSGGNSITSTSTVFIAPLTIDVDAAVVAGNGSGADWADAVSNLQTALTNAIAGQTLHVAGGIYLPTTTSDRTASFNLQNNIALYGGYAGSANPAAPDTRNVSQYQTILSGDIGISGNSTDNSYHVVVANNVNSTAILDGFSISGGNANGTGTLGYGYGGGFYCDQSAPTLNDCTFTNNSSGGAIYLPQGNPASSITNCTFTLNTTGAVYSSSAGLSLIGCVFSYNTSSGDAALDNDGTATISQCTFIHNTGGTFGAILNRGTATISDCDFDANTASSSNGEAGAIADAYYPATIVGCTFIDNSAGSEGGAIYAQYISPTICNCVFIGNSAPEGGAFYMYDGGTATVVNCTFTANSASTNGSAIYNYYNSTVSLTNSILWGDLRTSEIYNSSATINVTYSDIQGGYTGTSNTNADPQFIRTPSPGADGKWGTADDDDGDLHLQFTSPTIDAGSNAAIPTGITTDLDGNPRIFNFPGVNNGAGAVVDMGAYELGYNLDQIIVPTSQSLALPAGGYPFSANSITIGTGGSLDIADDSLTINYGTNPDPASTIVSLISSGYANDNWTGPGITSSLAAADTSHTTGVGYFDNGSQITIGRTWIGDANLDGTINADDLSLMLLGQTQGGTQWQDGNFNYDNQVNADDWIEFMYALAYSNGQPLPGNFINNSSIQTSDQSAMTLGTLKPSAQPFAQSPILPDDYLSALLDSSPAIL